MGDFNHFSVVAIMAILLFGIVWIVSCYIVGNWHVDHDCMMAMTKTRMRMILDFVVSFPTFI